MSQILPICDSSEPITVVQKHVLTLYTIRCTAEELSRLKAIDPRLIEWFCGGLTNVLGLEVPVPNVRMACCGRDAGVDWAPTPLAHMLLSSEATSGMWIPRLQVALVRFRDRSPIEWFIFHEMVHAVFDLATANFPYPEALEEGFACRAEYLPVGRVAGVTRSPRWHVGNGPSGYLSPEEFIPLPELLAMKAEDVHRGNGSNYTRFQRASYCFVTYLRVLQDRVDRHLLVEVRKNGLVAPDALIQWLGCVTGVTAQQIEEGFWLFCTRPGSRLAAGAYADRP